MTMEMDAANDLCCQQETINWLSSNSNLEEKWLSMITEVFHRLDYVNHNELTWWEWKNALCYMNVLGNCHKIHTWATSSEMDPVIIKFAALMDVLKSKFGHDRSNKNAFVSEINQRW